MRNWLVTAAVCVTIIVTTAYFAVAGDLNPPVGPIGPTHKTLTEVEPRTVISASNTPGDADSLFKISQPGSYYLTGNVSGVSAKHGIEIAVSGVTVDLMGFDLLGVAGTKDGVNVTLGGLNSIAVINGSVRNWGQFGVNLFDATNTRLSDLRVSGNAGSGIFTDTNASISFCSALSNAQGGIVTGTNCTVFGCAARDNGFIGIGGGDNCTVTNCSARTSVSNGISVGTGCTVTNCSAQQNGGDGISVGAGCTISNCSAQENTLDGIDTGAACTVRGNTCDSNGSGAGNGAGIHVGASGSRIEGNNCTRADRGIHVISGGNLIIRNSAQGNTTNYDIVGGNRYGPIINITGSGTAAVSGNSAASTMSTTDPWANLAF